MNSSSPTVAAVEIDALSKQFPSVRALDQVSLRVEQGEFFALLGPNGAGKTTLISILAGLTRASGGSARVMGYDTVRDYREARRHLGVVPQELVFDPFFTVRETLQLQASYYGLLGRVDDWIDEILENLSLADKANANMRELSGGMKRRVLVGQALVHRPPVVVLDEPTAGVDVELRQSLWTFIKRLNNEGHTIILTTHYLEEAQALCNRVAMLRGGRLVALDTTENLLRGATGILVEVSAERIPAAWRHRGSPQASGAYGFVLNGYAELEPLLAAFREEQVEITDLVINGADLERVFLEYTTPGAAGAQP